jgi:hypothetical protein
MSLDTLAKRTTGRGPRECGVAYALRSLDATLADALSRALANIAVTAQAIADDEDMATITDAPGADSISRHRAGKCRCGRTS